MGIDRFPSCHVIWVQVLGLLLGKNHACIIVSVYTCKICMLGELCADACIYFQLNLHFWNMDNRSQISHVMRKPVFRVFPTRSDTNLAVRHRRWLQA